MRISKSITWLGIACLAIAVSRTNGDDWPQWMGIERDGVWRETGILEKFPAEGPRVVWRTKVAGGYAGPAVAGGKVFLMDFVTQGDKTPDPNQRTEVEGTERVLCLDAANGAPLWKHEYAVTYRISYPDGPRCTPTVSDGLVYALGAEGALNCLTAEKGEIVWSRDLKADYGVEAPMWGFAGHPLVDGEKLICLVGGEGSIAVAFDRKTGRELWKSLGGADPGYSPPTLIEAGGRRQLIVFHSQAVHGLDPETGESYWSTPLVPKYGMAIMSPRFHAGHLFVGGIGDQSVLLKMAEDRPAVTEVWRGNPKTSLYSVCATPLAHEGVLYGPCQRGEFRAVEFETGKRLWETYAPTTGERPMNSGTAFVTRNGERFFLFSESGELVIAKLTREKYEELDRAKLLAPTTPAFGRDVVWSHPAYAERSIFARNDQELVCVSLAQEPEMPRVLDDRLTIERFASAPEIVTPTGLDVDSLGRVLVIECNTHFPPADYSGHPHDRILAMSDTDGDGRADRIDTFFEGTQATMNLAVYRDGSVFVATRGEVFRLRDTDHDGKADERTRVAILETTANYPHNALSGFAFDFAGNVYFGMGENLGDPYELIGADGTKLAGGGEGGNIFRIRADGSGLTRVATGFWNPFHLGFDAFGRLFAVDNDPDFRPPCRLLHIVEGGDYGFRYRNGRKGLHPFTAWNGELPGTLPMVAGTGEAPSGVLAYESDQLPEDYRGTLLATSWGDHRLDRFRLERRGASFISTADPFVVGGDNFRPVGIGLAPDGSLFVSDWVDKSYNVHGKGVIWRVRAKNAGTPKRPEVPAEAFLSDHRPLREAAARELAKSAKGRTTLKKSLLGKDDSRRQVAAAWALSEVSPEDDALTQAESTSESEDLREAIARVLPARSIPDGAVEKLPPGQLAERLRRGPASDRDSSFSQVARAALLSSDPFLRQGALVGLSRTNDDKLLADLLVSRLAPERLAGLLLARDQGGSKFVDRLPSLLEDPNAEIRFAAAQWVGEAKLAEHREAILKTMASEGTTRELFEACLATLERLAGVKREQKDEQPGEDYVAQLIFDPKAAPATRRRALRVLRPDHPTLTLDRLGELLDDPDASLRLETLRSIRERSEPEAKRRLASLALDEKASSELRAAAIVGLDGRVPEDRKALLALAQSQTPRALLREVLRSLREAPLALDERKRVAGSIGTEAEDQELLRRLLRPQVDASRPDRKNLSAWSALVAGSADAAAGERVFFHPRGPGCSKCHAFDGRGGRIAADLAPTGKALSLERMLESILQPSKEIAPRFVPWTIVKTDGVTLVGMLIGEKVDGAQIYATERGESFTVMPLDIEERHPREISIMPDNLVDGMTIGELRDLLAFLRGGADATP